MVFIYNYYANYDDRGKWHGILRFSLTLRLWCNKKVTLATMRQKTPSVDSGLPQQRAERRPITRGEGGGGGSEGMRVCWKTLDPTLHMKLLLL